MEKQFWVDFAEGRIDVPGMLAETEKRPELLDWLTGIADPKFKTTVVHRETDEDGYTTYTPEELPFDAKMQIEEYIHRDRGGNLGKFLNVHDLFSRVLTTAFPDEGIVIDQRLSKKFGFMLDACPEYIGGPEVDHLLEELLEELPTDLSKAKRVKLYKEKVKDLFPMAGKKYPRWVQEAEWPLSSSGKPMRFVEQKKGEHYKTTMQTYFIFEDTDTGETRTVEQFT